MDRRHFLSAATGLGALALSGGARADAATFRRFHAALERDPSLAVYADLAGDQAGEAVIKGGLPADLRGHFFRNGPRRFELGGGRHVAGTRSDFRGRLLVKLKGRGEELVVSRNYVDLFRQM